MDRPHARWRSPLLLALVLSMTVSLTTLALASLPADDGGITSASDTHGHNHAQHGSDDGHLNPINEGGLELIGRMRINQDKEGRASDVAVLGNHAYIGAFAEPNCQKGGVYVFDIANPNRPKQVNFIRTGGNSYVGEGVHVVNITTDAFQGDVLVMNNEICGPTQPSTVGGVTFVDVTDPKRHRYLARGVGDVDPPSRNAPGLAHESHSAFMWDAGDAAYAVIIDNEESDDLDILDISDPRAPVLIAEYDLNEDFPGIIDAVKGDAESFSHDMVVKQIDDTWYMLASYWDGGYVVLDVNDPTEPVLVADSDFAAIDEELLESADIEAAPEGNAHQAEWTADDAYIIGADEDFGPYLTTATADGADLAGASSGSGTPPLVEGQTISGQAVFVGRACAGDALPDGAAIDGRVAVVERGVCAFTEKVANVSAAGDPAAILIFNREGAGGCEATLGMSVDGDVPTFGVTPRSVGYDLFGADYAVDACLDGDGTVTAPIALGATGPTIAFASTFDGWGYVRLFDSNPVDGKLPLLDTYAIDEAHQPEYAAGVGDLSVHEVATSPSTPDLAYLAYYSGGVRVIRIVDDEIEETAAFIDVGGSNYWGVEVWIPTSGPYAGQELILASDRDYGVSIFRYTGEGAPAANLD